MGWKPRLSTTGNPHWCTSEKELAAARTFAGGRIALDPFGNAQSTVGALVEYHGLDATYPALRIDGRGVEWNAPSRSPHYLIRVAWVNPPYTRGVIGPCVEKAREEGRSGRINVLAIIPARLSASWWKANCWPGDGSDAVCYLGYRAQYVGASHPVPWETAIVHWGSQKHLFEQVFSELGHVELA